MTEAATSVFWAPTYIWGQGLGGPCFRIEGTVLSRNTISHPGLCQREPARWADPDLQAVTRRLCLSCPRLQPCRTETIAENRVFGMWAGVWIDHDLPAKKHLLQPSTRLRPISAPQRQRRTQVGKLPPNQLSSSAAALVTARASGHCEILAQGCLFDQQLIFTRATDPLPPATLDSPAAALAACRSCLEVIEHTSPDTALRYGYLTTTRTPITSWPVYWRQRHWLVLNHFGALSPLPSTPPTSGHLRHSA